MIWQSVLEKFKELLKYMTYNRIVKTQNADIEVNLLINVLNVEVQTLSMDMAKKHLFL